MNFKQYWNDQQKRLQDERKNSPMIIKVLKEECERAFNSGNEKVEKAIEMAIQYGGIDGSHHKDWTIDQIVRILSGDQYDAIVKEACDGEDGPETYSWECGIAP